MNIKLALMKNKSTHTYAFSPFGSLYVWAINLGEQHWEASFPAA